MTGKPIDIVKQQCIKVGEEYFNIRSTRDAKSELLTIPFDRDI
jgi:hypothetical protein